MNATLGRSARLIVLLAAVGALLFDGVELGLMPVASFSITRDLLGTESTAALEGLWFARYTASLMLGAAVGGIVLGGWGDTLGRTRALGISILFYSVFAGLGAFVQTVEQMLLLRFLVGLGVGGVWPNAVALAAECWPDKSRPVVAGIMGAALNGGILLLSQIARMWEITPESWRWIFHLAGAPALIGIAVLLLVPESPQWLASRAARVAPSEATTDRPSARGPIRELLQPPLLGTLLIGIVLGAVPLVGAWGASKWMIPWADTIGGKAGRADYKAIVQGWWALGAVLGSFIGSPLAASIGRRIAYAGISIGATVLTLVMFRASAPLQPGFLPIVFAQGLVATLFFGWLPLYLPELFPTRVRAAGSGIAFNIGRFITAFGVLASGAIFTWLGGSFPDVGGVCGLIYLLGFVAIWWAPDTSGRKLADEISRTPSTHRREAGCENSRANPVLPE